MRLVSFLLTITRVCEYAVFASRENASDTLANPTRTGIVPIITCDLSARRCLRTKELRNNEHSPRRAIRKKVLVIRISSEIARSNSVAMRNFTIARSSSFHLAGILLSHLSRVMIRRNY